jgi:protease PrsW
VVFAIAVALLPVLVFLLALVLIDSFKLVPTWMIVRAVAGGAAAALAAGVLHAWLFDASGLSSASFSRYVAPVTEETLKLIVLIYPLTRRQVGFLVDAAILGFSVGAGFALIENVEYLRALPERQIWLWIARGFGTAILHATTAAVMALAAKALSDWYPRRGLYLVVPGWAAAVTLHSAFNHALVSPLLAAALLMLALPLVVVTLFAQSDRMTREWVGDGLDLDMALLQLVTSTDFGNTRIGRYLTELKSRFPGPVVADMFCLLRLELELSIRAKGMLLAREAGLEVPVDDDLRARLVERRYLQRTIGRTGLLALRPLHVTSGRDDWHRYLLRHAGK